MSPTACVLHCPVNCYPSWLCGEWDKNAHGNAGSGQQVVDSGYTKACLNM